MNGLPRPNSRGSGRARAAAPAREARPWPRPPGPARRRPTAGTPSRPPARPARRSLRRSSRPARRCRASSRIVRPAWFEAKITSPSITGSPLMSVMLLRATPGRPPVTAVPQTVSPLRARTPEHLARGEGNDRELAVDRRARAAEQAGPTDPLHLPERCRRCAHRAHRRCRRAAPRSPARRPPPAPRGPAPPASAARCVPPVAGIERPDVAEAGGRRRARPPPRRSRRRGRRRAPAPSGTRLRLQASCPSRVTAVSLPRGVDGEDEPAARRSARSSSRRRLASPCADVDRPDQLRHRPQRRVDQPPAAPRRCGGSSRRSTTGAGSAERRRARRPATGASSARTGMRSPGRIGSLLAAQPAPASARRARAREAQRGMTGPPARPSAVAPTRRGRRRQRAARGDDELARPAEQRLGGRGLGENRLRSAIAAALSPASRCISARCSSASGRNGAPGVDEELERRLPAREASMDGPSSMTRSAPPASGRARRRLPSPATSPSSAAAPAVSPASAFAARLGEPRQHRCPRVRRGDIAEHRRPASPGRSRHRRRASASPCRLGRGGVVQPSATR